MTDNTPDIDKKLPDAATYQITARDADGNIASQGQVPADRVQKARRLFMDEGWTVEILPVIYGYPGPDLMDDAEAGRVVLGGCVPPLATFEAEIIGDFTQLNDWLAQRRHDSCTNDNCDCAPNTPN